MASFNLVVLVGNLVADPELKTTPSGISVTSFRIAVGRRYAAGEQQPQADFINIVCWRKTAEFVTKYFTKGKPILVRGTLQTRTWTDNNDVKHYETEVVADEVTFVERKGDGPVPAGPAIPTYGTPKAGGSFEELPVDDELPF